MTAPERVCSRCGASYGDGVIFCPQDGAPLTSKKGEVAPDPHLGLTLADQYEIERLIGIGAMARVYRAHQRGVERPVAVKILHRGLLENPDVVARFVREARVASRLTHPGVVSVLSAGQIPEQGTDVGGEAYLVMEYLDGISLQSALAASGGAIPLTRALHIALQLCDAVGEAHAQGIVHRDLKPENVMLIQRGDDADFVKVLDFGVARVQEVDPTFATRAGVIFGTARYVSPEGAQGKPVEPPGDVYSLATILYQCLCGQTPFDGDNAVSILVKQTSEPAPDVRSRARGSYVPEALALLLAKNLAKQPSERCRDASELGRALLAAARESGLSTDDLLGRSALSGSSGRPLKLASIERTRALPVGPELARQLAGDRSAPAEDEHDAQDWPATESLPPPPLTGPPRWLLVAAAVVIVLLISLVLAHLSGALGTTSSRGQSSTRCTKAAEPGEPWDPSPVQSPKRPRSLPTRWVPA